MPRLAAALVAIALLLPGPALAEEAAPSVEALVLDVTLRQDGGVDGELRATWRAGAAPIEAVWKTIGHGARVLAVTDADADRPLAHTTTLATHESRVDVALDRPIAPGQRRAIAISFDQTHVWHYDRATQTLSLNVPWVMSWEVGVRDVVQRVHVPPGLGPMPEPNGWEVAGRTLIARRAEGAPRLTLQMAVRPEAVDAWTAPLLATVQAGAWLALALLAVAPVAWWLGPRRRRTAGQIAELSPSEAAALLVPGDDRALVEACLLTLVERGAIALRPTDDGDVEATELRRARLAPAEQRWRDQLFGDVAPSGGERRTRISRAVQSGLHRDWRREVETDLGRAGLLEAEQAPGLDGLSYAGWAARERLRRELQSSVGAGGPGLAATAGLAAAALAIGVGAGAMATMPSQIELEGQQYAIGSIVFDGTPLVRLHYTLGRLLPLPPSHSHDYAENCGFGCGQGYFVGDHSCASSCGGVA